MSRFQCIAMFITLSIGCTFAQNMGRIGIGATTNTFSFNNTYYGEKGLRNTVMVNGRYFIVPSFAIDGAIGFGTKFIRQCRYRGPYSKRSGDFKCKRAIRGVLETDAGRMAIVYWSNGRRRNFAPKVVRCGTAQGHHAGFSCPARQRLRHVYPCRTVQRDNSLYVYRS